MAVNGGRLAAGLGLIASVAALAAGGIAMGIELERRIVSKRITRGSQEQVEEFFSLRSEGPDVITPDGVRRPVAVSIITFLLALTEETDDITLAEMQERLRAERSLSVGLGTLWRFFARRAVTWKKSQRTRPSRLARTWRPPARRGLRASPTSIPSA